MCAGSVHGLIRINYYSSKTNQSVTAGLKIHEKLLKSLKTEGNFVFIDVIVFSDQFPAYFRF